MPTRTKATGATQESRRTVVTQGDGRAVIVITPPEGHGEVWNGSGIRDRR